MRIEDKNKKLSTPGKTIHSFVEESGDLAGLVKLLDANPSLVNARNPDYGETPLHLAAKNGNTDAARLLLDRSADVEARTNNEMTPLHLAVGYALRSGDNSMVELLLDFNADCSATDDEGLIPLSYLPTGFEHAQLRKLLHVPGEQSNGPSDENQCVDCDVIRSKMDEFEAELSKMVGSGDLKVQLQKWAKGMLLDEIRRASGAALGLRKLPHMAFLGNSATDKTAVARMVGNLLHSVGVLSSNKVTEVQVTDLVGEFPGETGSKTRMKIEGATGGILFVNEAYRLAPDHDGASHLEHAVEALQEIISALEGRSLMLIFAGDTEPMRRAFASHAGLARKVEYFFEFDDFSCSDLAEMLVLRMAEQDEASRLYGFKLHPACTSGSVASLMEKKSSERLRSRMKSGLVDHMLNYARENLDSRLSLDSRGDELFTIMLEDLEAGLTWLNGTLRWPTSSRVITNLTVEIEAMLV